MVKFRTMLAWVPPSDDPWCLLVQWELPQTGAVLMRKRALEDVGGWKIDQPCCQEHELYLRLLCAGKTFRYSSAYGAVYRQWPKGSVSRRNVPEVLRQRLGNYSAGGAIPIRPFRNECGTVQHNQSSQT